jgi:nucleotide-binding universal stress UspA family protein
MVTNGQRTGSLQAGSTVRRIVVALDGSAAAEAILPIAATVARQNGAKITLVRACPAEPVDEVPAVTLIGRLADQAGAADQTGARAARHDAERYMDETVQRLRAAGLAADYELLEGAAGEAIVDEAEGLGADMVAMATHGRTGVGKLVLGSVAEYVIGHATCPVLLTRTA